jgi:streptogramin lyase
VTRARYALSTALLVAATARAAPVALTFEQAVYQDDRDAPLLGPEGIACGDSGAVVVADTGNARLLRFSSADGRLSGGREVKLPQLTVPTRVELDRAGGALVLDAKSRRIVRVAANGSYAGTVEPKGLPGSSTVNPGSFKVDADDNVWVLDVAGRRVLVVSPGGNVTRQLPLPRPGEFMDIALDPAGSVYAVDAVAAALWVARPGATAFAPLVKGMKDRMSFPTHMLVRKGKIYLVDEHGNGIAVLGIDGSFQGRALATGWGNGLVYYPSQICVTAGGDVLVADRYNNRVQQFREMQ